MSRVWEDDSSVVGYTMSRYAILEVSNRYQVVRRKSVGNFRLYERICYGEKETKITTCSSLGFGPDSPLYYYCTPHFIRCITTQCRLGKFIRPDRSYTRGLGTATAACSACFARVDLVCFDCAVGKFTGGDGWGELRSFSIGSVLDKEGTIPVRLMYC